MSHCPKCHRDLGPLYTDGEKCNPCAKIDNYLQPEIDQLRAEVERLKGKADECWGAANYRLKYLACLFRALGRPDDETIESNISNAAEQITQLRDALDGAEGALKWWQELKHESRGVAGYHMNGDVAEWDELDDPTEAALDRIVAVTCSGKADTSDSQTNSSK